MDHLVDLVDDATEALSAKRRARDELDLEISDLEAEVRGLRLALARLRPDQPPFEPVDQFDWVGLHRKPAIARLLLETPRLGPTAIAQELDVRGRKEKPDEVSIALNEMKKRGLVINIAYKWSLTPEGEEYASAS
jgi:hypothetical protein